MSIDEIASRIKTCREMRSLTQEELARQLDTTAASISRWERGETIPRGGTMYRLANILRVNVAWLKSGEGEMALDPNTYQGPQLGSAPTVREHFNRTYSIAESFSETSDVMRVMRWAATQADAPDLGPLGFQQIYETMLERGEEGVDEYHRGQLRERILQAAMSKGAALSNAKFEAIFTAAWDEGDGWGTRPDDVQLARYVAVAMA